MSTTIRTLLDDNPVIASIKDDEGLEAVLASDRKIVFVLYGSILTIGQIVERLKRADRIVLVNVDLIEGFASREIVVEFLAKHTRIDGVLSNRANLVKAAKRLNLIAVHRLFLMDSLAFDNVPRQLELSGADCAEILPGCIPTVLGWIADIVETPLIAGGLVCNKADVVAALGAGALAVASSNRDVWAM
ncbi:glycerol uptake operon antiterminator [Mycetocola sp. BIGb0189]|uniref:glycerol-3-phosphate responsive antiterminator n=1 Tax=Mycetocola sp. BIGb0189 TaxID=2940604 RepID=UPI0021674983|nr:glycerol-3-phosphate responsive antiterminator [Mycetocola sp. BIGb0189]MCS4275043.1 glycerol uptake operon antiterminator [Mycetocola sp. BIGb0189]